MISVCSCFDLLLFGRSLRLAVLRAKKRAKKGGSLGVTIELLDKSLSFDLAGGRNAVNRTRQACSAIGVIRAPNC